MKYYRESGRVKYSHGVESERICGFSGQSMWENGCNISVILQQMLQSMLPISEISEPGHLSLGKIRDVGWTLVDWKSGTQDALNLGFKVFCSRTVLVRVSAKMTVFRTTPGEGVIACQQRRGRHSPCGHRTQCIQSGKTKVLTAHFYTHAALRVVGWRRILGHPTVFIV